MSWTPSCFQMIACGLFVLQSCLLSVARPYLASHELVNKHLVQSIACNMFALIVGLIHRRSPLLSK